MHHSKLDALFTYNSTLVKLDPILISQILAGYIPDPSWTWLLQQIQANNDLEADAATMPFVTVSTPPTNSDFYLSSQPDREEEPCPGYIPAPKNSKGLPRPDKAQLFYHVNRLTNVYCLCISPSVAPDILAISHGKGYLGFSRYYEIITYF